MIPYNTNLVPLTSAVREPNPFSLHPPYAALRNSTYCKGKDNTLLFLVSKSYFTTFLPLMI